MGDGCYVFDHGDIKSGGLQGAQSGFSAGSGPLDINFNGFHTMFHCFFGSIFCCQLGRKGRTFARPLEALNTGTGPGNNISAYVGYGQYSNNAITARRFDLAKVDRLMQDAGWQRGPDGIWARDGQRYSVEVSYSREEHTPRLVVLKKEALKAGIELRLQRLDPAAQYKKVMEKRHDVGWLGWSTGRQDLFESRQFLVTGLSIPREHIQKGR